MRQKTGRTVQPDFTNGANEIFNKIIDSFLFFSVFQPFLTYFEVFGSVSQILSPKNFKIGKNIYVLKE